MRKVLCFVMCAGLASVLLGCKATPGFQVGWSVSVPPTMTNSVAMYPVPTAPQAVYAQEIAQSTPLVVRNIHPGTMPVPMQIATPPAQMPLRPQPLPMPRETAPAPGQGCQSQPE